MRLGNALNLSADLYDQVANPPSICGMIYAGERHVISGPPESTKTLITLMVCLEHIRSGGHVAFIDFESSPWRIKRMLRDIGATPGEMRELSYFDPEGVPDTDDIAQMEREQISLVVIDASAGAFTLSGLDDNSRMDVERFGLAWITPFYRLKMTTIVIDHVSKASVASGSRFTIGSERKIGMADVHLGIESISPVSRGTSGLVRVKTHKDRSGFLTRPIAAELELNSDPFTHLLTWGFRPPSGGQGADWKPTFLMEKVLEHFTWFPDAQSAEQLANAILGKREYVVKAVEALVADGRLTKDSAGKLSPQTLLIERDAPWDE